MRPRPRPFTVLCLGLVLLSLASGPAFAQSVPGIVVEAVVSRAGNIDTYTYTVENVDFAAGVAEFTVSGRGLFKTLAATATKGWTGTTVQDPCGNATWWVWTATGDARLDLGELASFSIQLAGPTWECAGSGAISPVDTAARKEHALPLIPCACVGCDMSFLSTGGPQCTCRTGSGQVSCSALPALDAGAEGFHLIIAPRDQQIASCDPCWATVSFFGSFQGTAPCSPYQKPCDQSVALSIDGVPLSLPMTHQVRQVPSGMAGTLRVVDEYFVQFPAHFFQPGMIHEITGVYTYRGCPGVGDREITRTATLVVEECP